MTKYFNADPIGFYDGNVSPQIPETAIEISDELYQTLFAGQAVGKTIQADKKGKPILVDPPSPTKEQIIASYESLAQKNLDAVAREWGYANMVTAASYAASTNPQYQADAQALIEWRDKYWAKAYTMEAKTLPATAQAFVDALPAAPSKPTV